MMVNVAIVDDDVIFVDLLKNKLLNLSQNINISCYQNPYDFIEDITSVDYVLLDIELPQIDGISLSKQLRNNNISIFFITIHKELMSLAFGKNVEGFILKDELDNGINNFLQFIHEQKEQSFIIIHTHYKDIKIYFDDIMFINYSLRDIEFFLSNNKKIIKKNINLKDILTQLNDDFVLVNRNIVVNIRYVDDLKDNYICLRQKKIKISRRKLKNIKIKMLERDLNNEF